MKSVDDLLIERRRGTLTADEAEELGRALGASPELELSLSAGEAFDRLETELPGDAALLEQLVAHAARQAPRSPWLKLRWLLVLPLLGVVGVAAWRFARAPEHGATPVVSAPAPTAPAEPSAAAPEALRGDDPVFEFNPISNGAGRPPPGARPPVADGTALSSAPATDDPRFGHEPRSAPRTPSPPPSIVAPSARARSKATRPSPRTPASDTPSTPNVPSAPDEPSANPLASAADEARTPPAQPPPSSTNTSRELENLRALSARELFARGNQARKRDWLKAETLYTLLLESYPSSPEAAVAELTLAKRALAVGRTEDALRGFRRHQERADALAAEAAWGECQALEQLGRRRELREAWQRLTDRHPDTSYAAVARRRLDALE